MCMHKHVCMCSCNSCRCSPSLPQGSQHGRLLSDHLLLLLPKPHSPTHPSYFWSQIVSCRSFTASQHSSYPKSGARNAVQHSNVVTLQIRECAALRFRRGLNAKTGSCYNSTVNCDLMLQYNDVHDDHILR